MRKLLPLLALVLIITCSCSRQTDAKRGWLDDSVAFKKQIANNFGFELVVDDADGYYSLWRNPEGITIWDSMGHGPANSKIVIRDAQGRPIVEAGKASEQSFYEGVKYLYDDDGTVCGFVGMAFSCYDDTYIDIPQGYDLDKDSLMDARYSRWPSEVMGGTGCPIIPSHEAVDLALRDDYSAPYYTRFYFERDQEGHIVRVYDPILHLAVKAPADGYLDYIVCESPWFWGSDILGGGIDLLFITRPLDPNNSYFSPDTSVFYKNYSEYMENFR